MTIQGLVLMVVTTLVRVFDLDLDSGYLTELISSIATVAGLIMVYVGRVRKGDINWWGKRV